MNTAESGSESTEPRAQENEELLDTTELELITMCWFWETAENILNDIPAKVEHVCDPC